MDPIADLITRIKNAGAVGKSSVSMPYSKFKFAVAQMLFEEGYIASVDRKGRKHGKVIEIGLAYENEQPKIRDIKRLSKLSQRIYMGVRDMKPIRQGYGDLVLSTPKGIMTAKKARKERVGGEALFTIW